MPVSMGGGWLCSDQRTPCTAPHSSPLLCPIGSLLPPPCVAPLLTYIPHCLCPTVTKDDCGEDDDDDEKAITATADTKDGTAIPACATTPRSRPAPRLGSRLAIR